MPVQSVNASLSVDFDGFRIRPLTQHHLPALNSFTSNTRRKELCLELHHHSPAPGAQVFPRYYPAPITMASECLSIFKVFNLNLHVRQGSAVIPLYRWGMQAQSRFGQTESPWHSRELNPTGINPGKTCGMQEVTLDGHHSPFWPWNLPSPRRAS